MNQLEIDNNLSLLNNRWKLINNKIQINIEFSNFDNASVENVIKAELAINSDLRVLSLFESDVELAAQLTEQFKLPGITKQQAEKFRNKMMMKKKTIIKQ